MNTILLTEEYWANSHLSIARYYGGIKIFGYEFLIVNKEGKDLFECSIEAEREGREKAIEPGEPCDLIRADFKQFYKKLGRDKFISVLKENSNASIEEMKKIMKRTRNNKRIMKTYNEKSAIERHGTLSQPRVYLSGAITGFKREEYLEKFANIEKQFREKGWAVINPAAVCDELPEMEHDEYLKITLKLLLFANYIYVIDGESTSDGVKLELNYADAYGVIRIHSCDYEENIYHPLNFCGECKDFGSEDSEGYGLCSIKQKIRRCCFRACELFIEKKQK